MKNLNKARIILFIAGLIFIIATFLTGILSVKTHYDLRSSSDCTLPSGIHIPININTADKDTLCLLDNIGEKYAEKIIDYRTEHGNFESKEDIKNIKGIGDKKYEEIKNYITAE